VTRVRTKQVQGRHAETPQQGLGFLQSCNDVVAAHVCIVCQKAWICICTPGADTGNFLTAKEHNPSFAVVVAVGSLLSSSQGEDGQRGIVRHDVERPLAPGPFRHLRRSTGAFFSKTPLEIFRFFFKSFSVPQRKEIRRTT
jgi:hypothetical protein